MNRLPKKVETFLSKWAANMHRAGYLEHTTAKVQDCILSYEWFIKPILKNLAGNQVKTFSELLTDTDWAREILDTSQRHFMRGVNLGMFIGCFKTLVHSVEELVFDSDEDEVVKGKAINNIRLYADALETIIVDEWLSRSTMQSRENLDRANRLLTLEKNKYENILASVSDLVLVIDSQGNVIETNKSAQMLLSQLLKEKKPAWQMLGLEGESMQELMHYYHPEQKHEIAIYDDLFFKLEIIPLSNVSLASSGFILVLNDITPYVNQRQILEKKVQERTEELSREKKQVEGMVVTLKNVLGTVEKSRLEQLEQVSEILQKDLLPVLDRIKHEKDDMVRQNYIDLLQDQMLNLAGRSQTRQDPRLLRLTPSEMKVCNLIQAGKSSKDIAETLNLSVGTIATHRRNIRKKIGLQGKSRNLYSFLQQPPEDPS